MIRNQDFMDNVQEWVDICLNDERIDLELHGKYDIKRGPRDKNGNGMVADLTKVSKVESNKIMDGVKTSCEGKLLYRGYNVYDLADGVVRDNRYGYEEIAYLSLLGKLPNAEQMMRFRESLVFSRRLPTNFVRNIVMRTPNKDIMIFLSKSILILASYDDQTWDISTPNVPRQSLMLISVMPMLMVYGYHAYDHYKHDESVYIRRPDENLSAAENLLRLLRPDKKYSEVETHVLDLALILHMEHGGGNSSTFTTHIVASPGTDTYSVVSATLAPLKGPKHGGANIKVVEMVRDLRREVSNTKDRDTVEDYLKRLLHKDALDKKGLIYGMDHAVYSESDPRTEIFKCFVKQLFEKKGREESFELYSTVKELDPKVISEEHEIYKGVSANVDFYSGFVYSVLDIPEEMFTPIFAITRIVGWNTHWVEELINVDKIICPTYTSVMKEEVYRSLDER